MTAPTTLQMNRIVNSTVLYIGFELAKENWKVAICAGVPDEMIVRTIDAWDMAALGALVEKAQVQFGVENLLKIYSIYEAGFDGFMVHRILTEAGVTNFMIDPASIEVNRRGRRRKTDAIDVRHLLRKLIAYLHGDSDVFSVCVVPSRADEDDRRLEREHRTLTEDRTRLLNRARGLLRLHGRDEDVRKLLKEVDELTAIDGQPVGDHAKRELARIWGRIQELDRQLKELEREREERLELEDPKTAKCHKIMQLKGFAEKSSWVLVTEMFGYREFKNRRKINRFSGLDSAPHDTGKSTGRSQGISKAGNKWVRAVAYSLTTNWLRWQPDSELSDWYRQRCRGASRTDKQKLRVGLARKILVRIWRWVEFDEVPRGAVFSD